MALWCWAHDPPFGWLGDMFLEIYDYLTEIYYLLYEFNLEYQDIWEVLYDVITESQIFSLLETWLTYAEDAWDWVSHAFINVVNIIVVWWDTTYPEVRGWIDIATEGLTELRIAWDNFWNTTFPYLVSFEWLNTWWNSKLIEIQSLIDTAIANLGIAFESWLEVKDSVLEFFSDPLQWVYNKLDEFFERFW